MPHTPQVTHSQKAGAVSGVDGKLRMDMGKFSAWCSRILEAEPEETRNDLVQRVIATQVV